ncbi:MAG: hypothetical protein K0Q78_2680 [Cellvibrio sp.]|jgi:hypothetical protein|nr:hypothetical protein [Cellvibrio sp.]
MYLPACSSAPSPPAQGLLFFKNYCHIFKGTHKCAGGDNPGHQKNYPTPESEKR